MECPEVSTIGDWEKHVYKCSIAIHVKWLSVSVRRSGANHKSPAVNGPYPGKLFLMTETTSPWHTGRTGTPSSPTGGAWVPGWCCNPLQLLCVLQQHRNFSFPFHPTTPVQGSRSRNGETDGRKHSVSVAFAKPKSNLAHLPPSPVPLLPGKQFALTQVRIRSAPSCCQNK